MAVFRLGSNGAEVGKLHGQLQALGLYAGPIDDDCGGDPERALKAFRTLTDGTSERSPSAMGLVRLPTGEEG